MLLLLAACIRIVTGIRSFFCRPRRSMIFMLARQLWQPVSAMADTSISLLRLVVGLNPRAV